MKIVFNSSPLIFLSRLDFLEKFIHNDHQFYLPSGVQLEISAKQDRYSDDINRLILNHQLVVKEIRLISLANRLNERLGRGESEAISLAIDLQADYIILDDFAARKEAMRLGLNVKGTLAVIRKLQLEGQINISDFDILYQRITEINFRVKRAIFDNIFAD
jgi:predicted nucleic acid-binding protein